MSQRTTDRERDSGIQAPNLYGLSIPEAALAWGEAGHFVLPCYAANYDTIRGKWSKKPHRMLPSMPDGEGGFKLATRDPAQIKEWWEKDPEAMIGVVPGWSGAVVLDVDGAEGVKRLMEVAPDFDYASTYVTLTPGGGLHIWYAKPPTETREVTNGRLTTIPGEARGNRGYVIVPPSRLPPPGGEYLVALPADIDEALS